jgi:heat shock protein HtpX
MNIMKTTLLLGTLTVLLVLLGKAFGGTNGALVALIMAGVMNFVAYWFSDKIVLSMYHARQVNEAEAPELWRIVKGLAERNGMPMPKVFVIPTEAPNAFATGRSPKHASVAATAGILRTLNYEEIEGVMGHELAHVQNRDMLTSTVAATIAGAVTWIAQMAQWGAMFAGGRDDNRGNALCTIVLAILAPFAALMIQMAISRSREYAADESGARMCGNPLALASALGRLEASARARPMTGGNPATASLFIVNPFRGGMMSFFSTHPPMEKRIARLQTLARERLS